MKRLRHIGLLAVVALAVAASLLVRKPDAGDVSIAVPQEEVSVAHPQGKFPEETTNAAVAEPVVVYATNPLSAVVRLPETTAPSNGAGGQGSLVDRLLSMVDAETLRKYEGSYTLQDLRVQGSGGKSFSLDSAWVYGGTNLPQAGLTVSQDPVTGEYKFSGGELLLPQSGLGISYEKDRETGETKTFLHLKRSF